MENQRQLNDCMTLEERWHKALCRTFELNLSIEEASRIYGDQLIAEVVTGQLQVDDLRAGVTWVNALDREVIEKSNDKSLGREDLIEAMTRRLAHQAGRVALGQVKNKRKLLINQVRASRRSYFGVSRQGM